MQAQPLTGPAGDAGAEVELQVADLEGTSPRPAAAGDRFQADGELLQGDMS